MGTLQSATLHITKYYITTYILNYVTQIGETPLSGPLWGISNMAIKKIFIKGGGFFYEGGYIEYFLSFREG